MAPKLTNVQQGLPTTPKYVSVPPGPGPVFPAGTIAAPASLTATLVAGSSNLAIGTAYFYKVTAVDNNGETTPSMEATATPTTPKPSIQLTWPAVTGALNYYLYRSTVSGQEEYIDSTTLTTYTDTGSQSSGTNATPPAVNETGTPSTAQVNYTYQVVPTPAPPPASPLLVQDGLYLAYRVATFIISNSGLIQQPVAGPAGTPCEILRADAGHGLKLVSFRGLRIGKKVQIPSADTLCPNETLAGRAIAASPPSFLLDGTPVYEAAAAYIYYLSVVPGESDSITVGALPFTNQVASANVIAPGDFLKTIMAPSQSPAGAPSTPVTY